LNVSSFLTQTGDLIMSITFQSYTQFTSVRRHDSTVKSRQ